MLFKYAITVYSLFVTQSTFFKNTNNRHPIARQWGQDMKCPVWVQNLIYAPTVQLPWCTQYCITKNVCIWSVCKFSNIFKVIEIIFKTYHSYVKSPLFFIASLAPVTCDRNSNDTNLYGHMASLDRNELNDDVIYRLSKAQYSAGAPLHP